ncbi:hypothetical protein O1Q80_00485 [Lonepinella sp. MS14435]
MMKILKIQTFATLQDLGRFGFRSLGIGQCGAMDTLALKAGNLLLANQQNACAIEIALGSMTVQFEQYSSFCITGAFYEAYLDNEPVYSYWRYPVRAGQILQFVKANYGMYGYLCVQGGFDVPLELGSRSTDLKTQLGGWQGRALQEGDQLPLPPPKAKCFRTLALHRFYSRIHCMRCHLLNMKPLLKPLNIIGGKNLGVYKVIVIDKAIVLRVRR